MICPGCENEIALSWGRYLASYSGRHTCPRCETTFRFRITPHYLRLWLDVLAGSVVTGIIIQALLTHYFAAGFNETQIFLVAAGVSTFVWGSFFLVANRRALDQLTCRPVSTNHRRAEIKSG